MFYVYPNVFTLNPLPFKGIVPSSESWPIDFSMTVQDDPLLKFDKLVTLLYFLYVYFLVLRITYPSNFYTDNEPSSSFSSQFHSCFRYSLNAISHACVYRFDYCCPLCDFEHNSASLNCLKLAVLVHLRVVHRNNPVLVKMCEEEMLVFMTLETFLISYIFSRFFNEAFGVNFVLFVNLGSGPRL